MNNIYPACEIIKHFNDFELDLLARRLTDPKDEQALRAVWEEKKRRRRLGSWECEFEGRCDVCGRSRLIDEVSPGTEMGWRVGYICYECKLRRQGLEVK
jgi:hypothetical protein